FISEATNHDAGISSGVCPFARSLWLRSLSLRICSTSCGTGTGCAISSSAPKLVCTRCRSLLNSGVCAEGDGVDLTSGDAVGVAPELLGAAVGADSVQPNKAR